MKLQAGIDLNWHGPFEHDLASAIRYGGESFPVARRKLVYDSVLALIEMLERAEKHVGLHIMIRGYRRTGHNSPNFRTVTPTINPNNKQTCLLTKKHLKPLVIEKPLSQLERDPGRLSSWLGILMVMLQKEGLGSKMLIRNMQT